ncbi:hypothetical protein GCM10027355_01070 [Haloplanus salinarum]
MISLAVLGLLIDAVGATLVVLPEIPRIGSTLTTTAKRRRLESAYETLYEADSDVSRPTIKAGRDSSFDAVADLVEDRLGDRPASISLSHDEDGVATEVHLTFPSGANKSLKHPTLIADLIRFEQERITSRRKGYFLGIGIGLLAIGILVQIVATYSGS